MNADERDHVLLQIAKDVGAASHIVLEWSVPEIEVSKSSLKVSERKRGVT